MIKNWGPLEFAILAAVILAILLAVGWYLSYTAVRLDRLHHRVIGTAAALDAQLARRAEAALEVAYIAGIDPASATLLATSAAQALDHTDTETWSQDRLDAESQLTEVLRVTAEPGQPGAEVGELLTRLRGVGERVKLARRFHNEAVSETRQVRGQRLVRGLHLAGAAKVPKSIDFDDNWPSDP